MQPDLGRDRGTDGPGGCQLPARQPRPGADGAARCHRLHRIGFRQHHAGLLDHPGIVGARLQHAVGAEGQLADRAHARADLGGRGRHSHPQRLPPAPGHALRDRGDPPAQARVRQRGGDHRQDHGAVDAGLSLLRGRALPADVPRRSRQDQARARPHEGRDHPVRHGADRGRRRCADGPRSRHRRPGERGLLQALPQGSPHRVRGAPAGAAHPPYLRAHRGPHGLHRRDRDRRLPLRFQEQARRVHGGDGRPRVADRQHQQSRDALCQGARGRASGRSMPISTPACRRWGRNAPSRCRPRSRTCARFRWRCATGTPSTTALTDAPDTPSLQPQSIQWPSLPTSPTR